MLPDNVVMSDNEAARLILTAGRLYGIAKLSNRGLEWSGYRNLIWGASWMVVVTLLQRFTPSGGQSMLLA